MPRRSGGEGGGGGKRWNEKDVDDPLPHGDVMYIHTYTHVVCDCRSSVCVRLRNGFLSL